MVRTDQHHFATGSGQAAGQLLAHRKVIFDDEHADSRQRRVETHIINAKPIIGMSSLNGCLTSR